MFDDNLRVISVSFFCSEAATRGVLWKKVFLEISQSSQENTCARASLSIKLQAWGLQLCLKETLAQVFSCEFWEISKNTFFTEHLWVMFLFAADLNLWSCELDNFIFILLYLAILYWYYVKESHIIQIKKTYSYQFVIFF